jgi:archaellum component FlaF (FlaF/FlaG flagellin family)
MKKISGLICIILLLLLAATASAATTTTTSDSTSTTTQDAASLVYVSSVKIDPVDFYPYEQGTVTVTLTNGGTSSVGLSNPDILSDKIHILNKDSWSTMSFIGPGSTITYSFLVTADPPDGTYFPLFSVGTQESGSIHYPLIIKVDSADIQASISLKPEVFAISTKDTVNLSIINPRDSSIQNIIITPTGQGIDVSPSQKYISSLNGQSSVEIPFSVTPNQQSSLNFHISYQNGDNDHATDVILPIVPGDNKKAAIPIVNNVELVSSGSSYTLTGDINNAGLTDAKSMIVTVGAPALAVEPYAQYAIGSLAADDFSSFEITFTAKDLSSIPLVITWKDKDGNSFSTTKNLNLRSNAGSGTTGSASGSSGSSSGSVTPVTTGSTGAGNSGGFSGGGPRGGGSIFGFGGSSGGGISSFYPVIAAGIIIIAGIVLWIKRKWIAAKLKKR